MTEDVVPAAAVLAVRRITGHREAGKQLWPEKGPSWDYPPLAQRPSNVNIKWYKSSRRIRSPTLLGSPRHYRVQPQLR
eukprot:2307254-Pyramimonas_sp.AAC.1